MSLPTLLKSCTVRQKDKVTGDVIGCLAQRSVEKKLGTRIGFHNAFAKVLNHMQGDPQSHPTLDNEQANGP